MGQKSGAIGLLIGLCLGNLAAQTLPGGQGGVFPGQGTGVSGFPGQGSFPGTQDTTTRGQEKPVITPHVEILDREAFFVHGEWYLGFRPDTDALIHWDEAARAEGFVRHMGQTGKPHQVIWQGLDERFFRNPQHWQDPVTGHYNRYVLRPLYLDTRAPVVRAQYIQGARDLQLVQVLVSQNVTPRWNFSLQFDRRIATGAYRAMTTDHTQGALTSQYHTANNRYQAFVAVSLSRLSDEINGGVPRSATVADFPQTDGLIQDLATYYNQSFVKDRSAPVLETAQRRQSLTAASLDHYCYLTCYPDDSVQRPVRITLRQETLLESNRLRFVDESISLSTLSRNLIRVYPTLAADSTDLYEGYQAPRLRTGGAVSLTWAPGLADTRLHVDGGIAYVQTQLTKDTTLATLLGTAAYGTATLQAHRYSLTGRTDLRLTSLFEPEQGWEGRLDLYPLAQGSADSTMSLAGQGPLRVSVTAQVRTINPTLFQAYFVGDSGNVYQPGTGLLNQRMQHATAAARWDWPGTIRTGDTLLPGYAQLTAYVTRLSRMIYYSEQMTVLQARTDDPLRVVGLELKAQSRLTGRWYGAATIQGQLVDAVADTVLRLYVRGMPQLTGKGGIWYENDQITFAEWFKTGIEITGFTGYAGHSADPISGEFFPTRYEIIPYVRVDAYVILRLRGVYLFAQAVHLNEQLLYAGYYTTPFYPMLERTLSLGVNWQFNN